MQPFWAILAGLPTTIALSTLAMVIGVITAIPLMLCRRSSSLVLRAPARAVIDVFRAIPPIVWLFIIFFGLAEAGLTLSPFAAATVGLGAVSAAYLAEIYRGGLMAIDKGQWEAGQSLALSTSDLYRYVLAPQALAAALPAMATYGVGLIKDTALAYTIGVKEVLFNANHESLLGSASALSILAFAALLYASLSLTTAYAARRLDRNLRAKVAR